MAQPAPYHDNETSKDRYWNEHHRDLGQRPMRVRSRAVVLAKSVVLTSQRDQAPTYVPFDARWRGIARLRLDLASGRAFVNSVEFVFADGHRETMPVRQMLSRRGRSIALDMPSGGVRGFFIDTAQTRFGRGGGWSRASRAVVNVIGLRDARRAF